MKMSSLKFMKFPLVTSRASFFTMKVAEGQAEVSCAYPKAEQQIINESISFFTVRIIARHNG